MKKTASSLAVGALVNVTINSIKYPFVVAHQGNPDTAQYSDGGTWLFAASDQQEKIRL